MQFYTLLSVAFAGLALAAPQIESSSMSSREAAPIDTYSMTQDVTPVNKLQVILEDAQSVVSNEVHGVVALCSGAKDTAAQHAITAELVVSIHEIAGTLVQATTSILAIVLPTALNLVGDVLELVGAVLSIVLALVGDIVGTLVAVVEGLLDPTKALVLAELKAVLAVLGPIVVPILTFAKDVAGQVVDVKENITEIVSMVNGCVAAIGLPPVVLS